jgi:hypothetical protein
MHFHYLITFCANPEHDDCGKWELNSLEEWTDADRKLNRGNKRAGRNELKHVLVGIFETIEAAATAIANNKAKRSSPPWAE